MVSPAGTKRSIDAAISEPSDRSPKRSKVDTSHAGTKRSSEAVISEPADRPPKRSRVATPARIPSVGQHDIPDNQIPADEAFVKSPLLATAPSAFGSFRNGDGGYISARITSPAEECNTVTALQDHLKKGNEICLKDFTCYRHVDTAARASRNKTMASLNELGTNADCPKLAFDGVLYAIGPDGTEKAFPVHGIPFTKVSIEGYGSDQDKSATAVYIRSKAHKKSEVWYRLETPSEAYARYHAPFLWLVEFAMYFVSFLFYLDRIAPDGSSSNLAAFRSNFDAWLRHRALKHADYDSWRAEFRGTDFRGLVTTYYDFLWKESMDVGKDYVENIPLWREIDPSQLYALKHRTVREQRTVCTPYAYSIFHDAYFVNNLLEQRMVPSVHRAWKDRAEALGMTCTDEYDLERRKATAAEDMEHYTAFKPKRPVVPGDIVLLPFDKDWTKPVGFKGMYAYVQDVSRTRDGKQALDLIWLYLANDTILKEKSNYPFPNELFMSDHCNHGESSGEWTEDTVLGLVDVARNPRYPEREQGLFMRQTYILPQKELGKDVAFRTLQEGDFVCPCRRPKQDKQQQFPVKSTVLFKNGGRFLEPAIVERYLSNGRVILRCFERRQKRDASARRSELLETSKTVQVSSDATIRLCIVRRYATRDVRSHSIPAPYSCDGTGDTWTVTGRLNSLMGAPGTVEEVDLTSEPSFLEGFDPNSKEEKSRRKLNGLSLFSGAGSFDRGLEEGGVLKTKWAVEMKDTAAHAYRANLRDPDETQIYWGSVNDHLKRAVRGYPSSAIPDIGEVDFICGGSPCKGFSMATQDKSTADARGYASLVASMVSYVDLYRPGHLIMENVPSMSNNSKVSNGQNPFQMILAALVGLGYQTSVNLADAWTHGSCQNRSRLLIMATAPDLEPMRAPVQSHEHDPDKNAASAGKGALSAPYGFRSDIGTKCPHPLISAEEATLDLPSHDGMLRTVIQVPSHRTSASVAKYRPLLMAMPREPRGISLSDAVKAKKIPAALLEQYKSRGEEWHGPKSKAFKRIEPTGLFPTIKTSQRVDCGRMGDSMHWDDPRSLTIMEARRAQSIPDHEVLIGAAAAQFSQAGNGVDRKTSVALGLSLRHAWLRADRTNRYLSRVNRT